MEKIQENLNNNKVYEALIELRLFASSYNQTSIVNWCDKELDGYLENDIVPRYREVDSNMWKIRFSIDGFPSQLAKFNHIYAIQGLDEKVTYSAHENILTISDIIRMTNEIESIENRKLMLSIIDNIKNKKLLCKEGLKDLEVYTQNKTIAVTDQLLDYIANVSPFPTEIGLINPNTRQFIVDKDHMYNKVIEGIKRRIIYEINNINTIIENEKKNIKFF